MKFVLILCLLLAGCSHSGANDHGGQDGGGGEGPTSSPEQVRAAIAQAYLLATDSDFNRNVFKRFWLSEIGIYWTKTYFNPAPLFPHVAEISFLELKPEDFSSEVLASLAAHPPNILDHGVCAQSSRKHADASVSSYTPQGAVCFSLERLVRYPPDDLLGEMLALLLHESIHLGGERSEAEAEAWQNRFRDYFHWRFGTLASSRLRDLIQRNFIAGQLLLMRARHRYSRDGDDPAAAASVGAFAMDIVTIPDLFDPLTLELTLKPIHPEFYNNFANAVLATYEQTVRSLEGHDPPLPMIEKLMQMHTAAYRNYKAYARGDGPSTCILPEAYGLPADVFSYLNVSSGEPRGGTVMTSVFAADVSAPPLVCSGYQSP